MSKHHIEKVTCPSCHHEGDFEVWDSINTVLDPAMKEKVLNQSIFLYTCPNCGETFRLNYPTLYHQMEEYYGAAEPPVRCGESHLSGLTEPLRSL